MNTTKAAYAGSFDPVTNGHLNIINRAALLYGELIIFVAVDFRKNYLFSAQERAEMVRQATKALKNVHVKISSGHYVVKEAQRDGVRVLIRGLRGGADLEQEDMLANENRRICPNIETIWLPALPRFRYTSSTVVRGHLGADPNWQKQIASLVPAFVRAKLQKKLIEKKAEWHWNNLIKRLGKVREEKSVFEYLLQCYSEEHRSYHTMEHIVRMLDELERIAPTDTALLLAVWFHDAVYETTIRNSEEQSAALAQRLIRKMGLPKSLGNKVRRLIMVTKHTTEPINAAARELVDLDLSIFAASKSEFRDYEKKIRKEYKWVSETDFRMGRLKILEFFLRRRNIFLTPTFRAKYEKIAKINLENSIRKLRG